MENMMYFAIFGDLPPALPRNARAAYGGFGFDKSGKPRLPYAPPKDAAILFDDSVLPSCADFAAVQNMLDAYSVHTVFFDFEKPKNETLCNLLSSVRVQNAVVPLHYAGVCVSRVLSPAYRPNIPYEAYLQAVRRRCVRPVIDLSPIGWRLKDGVWTHEHLSGHAGGQFSEKHQCMYQANGTQLHFYDTKSSLLARAAASGLPCLLPFDEYQTLE